jgi:TolB-like protein/Tfp pilus assembly protein PilF
MPSVHAYSSRTKGLGVNEFWLRLKQRKLVQWAIAYVAFWFALLQGVDIVAARFNWPAAAERYFILALAVGFCVMLVLVWYHGERGAQHVGSMEIMILALLLAIGGALVWRFGPTVNRHAEPVTTVAAAAAAPVTRTRDALPVTAQPIPAKSIAVLPFENLSNDKDNAYFVAGMQDLILTKLADIGDLKVISRTSTEKYKSRPDNLKQVGAELGVATILEGSVQKAGKQVLINVQLIDTRTDSHIWAQSYQRTLDNIFGVEGDVAQQIAAALKTKLSGTEAASLAAVPTHNQAAMDLFLRAEFLANKGFVNYDIGSFRSAIPLYRQAIEQDAGFALAYAKISWAESALAWFGGGGLDVKQLHTQARADAGKALKLAPNASASLLALGYSDYYGRGDYAGALKAFAAALALKPNDSDALAAQGYVQRRQGLLDEAIASLERAFALDPRNSSLAYELGSTRMMAGRYPEAQAWFQRALAIDPDNLNAKFNHANAIAFSTGDIQRALAAAQGDDPALKLTRITLLTYQRRYSEALALLGSIPDTPDNFPPALNGPKIEQQAGLYRLMGEGSRARPLFVQALPVLRRQLEMLQGIGLANQWLNIAYAEIGSGQAAAGLDAIAKALKISADTKDRVYGPQVLLAAAQQYAQTRRPDLAVPTLAKALAAPGSGTNYSPVLLWLDPMWDPIRHDSRFESLLRQYAKYKPAVTYPDPTAASS